jgi:RNA polymerase sigma-70 factor, ECF subfamily
LCSWSQKLLAMGGAQQWSRAAASGSEGNEPVTNSPRIPFCNTIVTVSDDSSKAWALGSAVMSFDLDETVSAAQSGEPGAFDDLVRATYSDTYSLALRLVGNAEDAKDVAQDTYLRAFKALSRFRGEANVATWLYRITSNCASTLITRRRKIDHDELTDDSPVADVRPGNDPAVNAETGDLRAQIIDALAELPEKLRSVIVLRDIYDLSHEAIAKQLDISETAAKVRLHRARHKLRELLFGDEETAVAARGEAADHAPVLERQTQDTSTMAVVRRVKARAPRISKDRTVATVLSAETKLAKRSDNAVTEYQGALHVEGQDTPGGPRTPQREQPLQSAVAKAQNRVDTAASRAPTAEVA